MRRTSRKCGRCGSREGVRRGQTVEGYGNVCPPCLRLCAFPVEAAATGLAALVSGAVPLRLGFNSYRELRGRYAAARRAAEERAAEARREAERAASLRLDKLREHVRRMPRSKRRELARKLARVTNG
jgi:hypothetical protein